jgi:hypothetical protein
MIVETRKSKLEEKLMSKNTKPSSKNDRQSLSQKLTKIHKNY